MDFYYSVRNNVEWWFALYELALTKQEIEKKWKKSCMFNKFAKFISFAHTVLLHIIVALSEWLYNTNTTSVMGIMYKQRAFAAAYGIPNYAVDVAKRERLIRRYIRYVWMVICGVVCGCFVCQCHATSLFSFWPLPHQLTGIGDGIYCVGAVKYTIFS